MVNEKEVSNVTWAYASNTKKIAGHIPSQKKESSKADARYNISKSINLGLVSEIDAMTGELYAGILRSIENKERR